jgi:glycosyltransferase involved in cell wall biosynthesis
MLALRGHDERLKLRLVPSLGREISPLDDIRALGRVTAIAREFRPDIVHTHLAKAGTIGRLAARAAGARIVIHTYHGTVFRGYFGTVKSRAFVEIERALSHVTTRIVAITPGQRRELIELGIGDERKVVEIPLGLDLGPFLEPIDRTQARSRLDLPPNKPVVAIVARLVPVKNVSLFLRAMASVPSAVALIVGDGELRGRLQTEAAELGIADRSRFVGWQSDVRTVYAAADVVALTSNNEGSPVSIIEAMAVGRSIVSTAVGGVPDVVRDGVDGVLVRAGDANALAAAINSLLADSSRRARLGAAGRLNVERRYDASRLVADVTDLYESLL